MDNISSDQGPPLQTKNQSNKVAIAELLYEISQRPTKHVMLSPGTITPYDAYANLIESVKKTFTREHVRKLRPDMDPNSSIESILTPSFVCSLALIRLRKILEIPDDE